MSFLATAAAAAGGGAAAAASMASGAPARSKRANGGKWRRQRQRRPASRSVDGALWNRIGIGKKNRSRRGRQNSQQRKLLCRSPQLSPVHALPLLIANSWGSGV